MKTLPVRPFIKVQSQAGILIDRSKAAGGSLQADRHIGIGAASLDHRSTDGDALVVITAPLPFIFPERRHSFGWDLNSNLRNESVPKKFGTGLALGTGRISAIDPGGEKQTPNKSEDVCRPPL